MELSRTARTRSPRLWALWAAARPSQVALVLLLYLLGVGMARAGSPVATSGGEVVPGAITLGALTLLPTTVAIHYANEYADADTDRLTGRTPFSGGSGALVETGLPRAFLGRALVVTLVVAVVTSSGAVLAGLDVTAMGLLSVILVSGVAYSLPPVALVRRGVGELVNATLGGLLLPLYGASVVSSPTPAAALAVVPFTLLVGCNLLATHWPDREADAAVGKRTLAVRWSPRRIRRVYVLLAVVAGGVTAGLWTAGLLPAAVVLAHVVPVPFLVWGGLVLARQRSPLPAVLSMVSLAVAETVAWWWIGGAGALPP
ncbi:MAG: prenyltransferase [Halolamina sp.]|uniref:prenyltransferase n=1 Tax=Halolamina sp. TaxID=1940283 RepID=UPI002FC3982C